MAKMPQPAPSGQLDPSAFARMLEAAYGRELHDLVAKANRDYVYWDRFKHFDMPDGLSAEDAWRFLRMLRRFDSKPTPIRDTHGHPFTYSMTDELQRLTHVVDQQAGGPVTGAGIGLPKDSRRRFVVSALMEEAIASSQIEGASTTRQAAKDMLRSERPPSDRSERMILNNYRTIQALRELKDSPLTIDTLVRIQAWLTEDAIDRAEDVGRLRDDDDVFVHDSSTASVLHVPPPADQLREELGRLCDFADSDDGSFIHPVIKACALHFWLGYLHPFGDGNGRTARALFYLHMLRNDYWLFEYVSISRVVLRRRAQYDRAYLYSEVDECDLTYFLTFHMRAVEQTLSDLWDYLEVQIEEDRALAERLRHHRSLNHRQRAVLGRALEDPAHMFTIESHRNSHDVAYATARKDLLELTEWGYLDQERDGRAFVFAAAPGLRDRLDG